MLRQINTIGELDLETNNKINSGEKVDNTKIAAKMLSEQERLSAQIVDNRKEITELTEDELRELENATKQFEKDSFEHFEYLRENFKYIGEEIPEDIPVVGYYRYIFRNFGVTKPKKEWTDVDYRIYDSWHLRTMAANALKCRLEKQKIPLIDRQKRIIERVRNGTDFSTASSKEFSKRLQ